MFGKSPSRPSVGTAAKDFTTTTPGHRLQFLKGSDTLIVSFDNAARAKNTPFQGRTIWGEKFYREEGHSLLGVIAATNDWFRCRHLITALEDLSGSGFFRQFENVVFAGSSMGAFGAAAFAPLAPGCTVLSLSPQATLDRARVPWERRFAEGLDQDWSLPYGDAATGLRAAKNAYVFYDPLNRPDKRHADMIAVAPATRMVAVPAGGHGVPPMLVQTGLMKRISRQVIAGQFQLPEFAAAIRSRKTTIRYYRMLAREALLRGRPSLCLRVCAAGLVRFPHSDLSETRALALAAQGKPVLALRAMDDARDRLMRNA